jgi:hypothetical protein
MSSCLVNTSPHYTKWSAFCNLSGELFELFPDWYDGVQYSVSSLAYCMTSQLAGMTMYSLTSLVYCMIVYLAGMMMNISPHNTKWPVLCNLSSVLNDILTGWYDDKLKVRALLLVLFNHSGVLFDLLAGWYDNVL